MKHIKAYDLQPGMWLLDQMAAMLIDAVEDTRNGRILVRCGYRPGDDSITLFYEREDDLYVKV